SFRKKQKVGKEFEDTTREKLLIKLQSQLQEDLKDNNEVAIVFSEALKSNSYSISLDLSCIILASFHSQSMQALPMKKPCIYMEHSNLMHLSHDVIWDDLILRSTQLLKR